jgi:hypothetical protein
MMALMGVRISWLMFARNWLLARFAASARARARSASWKRRAFSSARLADWARARAISTSRVPTATGSRHPAISAP